MTALPQLDGKPDSVTGNIRKAIMKQLIIALIIITVIACGNEYQNNAVHLDDCDDCRLMENPTPQPVEMDVLK